MIAYLVFFILSHYAPDHIIVKLKPNVQPNALATLNSICGIEKMRPLFMNSREDYGMNRIYILKFDENKNVDEIINIYKASPLFEYAEPDYIGHGHFMPDDTYFANQWGLRNTGQNPSGQQSGYAGCDIQADSAWDIEIGSRDVIIAILDTGSDLDHPDLRANPSHTTSVFWRNVDEIPNNSIDDDGNGYVDDTLGYNFADTTNNVQDDHSHGSINAGIAGARGNNSVGVTGIDMYCRIMTVKVLDNTNWGLYSWWANGLQYAADNGARVINMSMGGYSSSTTLETAINYAWSQGCIITVSMGNDNSDTIQYPAYYDSVIAVGATDNRDQRCNPSIPGCNWGSNYGSWIDVVAPGYWIYSTDWNNTYAYWSGTSMAAPMVAGIAGLIWAYNPTLSKYEVRDIIETTAEDLGNPGFDIYYGHGRVNAYNALTATPSIPDWYDEIQLTSTDGYASWEPEVAANRQNVHVIFSDARSNYSLYYKRSTDYGINWTSDAMIADYQTNYSYFYPSIALIGDTIFVAFCDDRTDSAAVYFKRSTDNGVTWQSEVIISDPAISAYECDIAVSGNNVYVVWDQGFRRSTDGGTTWQAINSNVKGSAIAASNQYIHVAYDAYVNDTSQIFYRRYNGTSWELPVQITYFKGAVWPDIAADGNSAYLVWSQNTDNDLWYDDIFARRSTNNGSNWANAKQLTDAGRGSQYFVYPRVDAKDSVYIAYFGDRDEYFEHEIYLIPSIDQGSTWAHTLRMTRDTLLSELPALAVAGDTVHLVWDNVCSASKEIFYRGKGGLVGIGESIIRDPSANCILACYPNPFSKLTTLSFSIGHPDGIINSSYGKARRALNIYDATGRLVKSFRLLPDALRHTQISWDGTDQANRKLPSGVYFVRFEGEGISTGEKIIKLK